MQHVTQHKTPLGEIFIAADEQGLTGLWFVGQKYFDPSLATTQQTIEIPLLKQAKKWLDICFRGEEPDFELPLHFTGTKFQNEVWKILSSIPYGQTMTYGEIATILAKQRGVAKMSAQAVGGAVGKNKISIIVPCHRVVGVNGNLTGYAGGIDKKIQLLKLEHSYRDDFYSKIST